MSLYHQNPGFMFQLVELSTDQLTAAFQRLQKAGPTVQVREHFEGEFFEEFKIVSNERLYTVVRLGYFAYCNCKSFEHTRACKHVAATLPPLCVLCLESRMQRNFKCYSCYEKSEGFARRGAPVTSILAA